MLCWNSLPSRQGIVHYQYYYHWREMQKSHPWHSLLASSIWIIYRLLNNSAQQSRCLTLLNHRNKLKTQIHSFSGWLAWLWSLCIPYSLWIPTQPPGTSFFPLQRGGTRWQHIWRQRSWLLQRNSREAATCRRHFRCADQSSSYRSNGLLPYPVWKVVLFSKWCFIVTGTRDMILFLPLEPSIWGFFQKWV